MKRERQRLVLPVAAAVAITVCVIMAGLGMLAADIVTRRAIQGDTIITCVPPFAGGIWQWSEVSAPWGALLLIPAAEEASVEWLLNTLMP